jgi:hypothetical protein
MATKIQNLAQQAVSIYRKQGWEAFVGFCEENPQITRRALEHAGMVNELARNALSATAPGSIKRFFEVACMYGSPSGVQHVFVHLFAQHYDGSGHRDRMVVLGHLTSALPEPDITRRVFTGYLRREPAMAAA